EHLRVELKPGLPGHPALLSQLRGRAGPGGGERQSATAAARLGHRPARGLGGGPVGKRPAGRGRRRGGGGRTRWGARAGPGPCGQLARAKTVKVVLGPGTFVNEAADQIDEQLSAQTKQAEARASEAERVVRGAALKRGLPAPEAQKLGRQASRITLARFQEGL